MKKLEKRSVFTLCILLMAVCALFVSGLPQKIVIAETIGDYEVSGAEYQLYYYREYYDYLAEHAGEDLSARGLYTNSKHHRQESPYGMTWDEYFEMLAQNTLQEQYILCLAAEEAGYTLSEDGENTLAAEWESIAALAEECGLDSGEEYLKEVYGAGVTLELYETMCRRELLAAEYKEILSEDMAPTEEDIVSYLETHASGDAGNAADVVFIVMSAEADRYTQEVTERQEENLKIRCDHLLEAFEEAGGTAEAFCELAALYSEETDASITLGVHEDARGDSDPESVADWYTDTTRQEGDVTVIFEGTQAYLLYYLEKGESLAVLCARESIVNERIEAYLEEAREQYPVEGNALGLRIAKL